MNIEYIGSLAKISFMALIASSLILPLGVIAGIPVKHITYAACLVTLLAYWHKGAKINKATLVLFISVLLFIAFYFLVGTLRATAPFYAIFTEGMAFFTTLTVTLLILIANSCKIIEDEGIILTSFYGVFIFSLWKSAMFFLISINAVSFDTVANFIQKYMGFKTMVMAIPGELNRLTFAVNDFITGLFLFLVPTYPRLFSRVPVFIRVIFMITGIVVLVSAFSRYKFAFVAILWFYSFLFKFSFKQRLITCFTVATILFSSLPWLIESFELRFMSASADLSDSIRLEQIIALLAAWEDLPIIGGGLGYFAKDFIRNEGLFSYEVQWISFFPKFGMIGVTFLLLLVSFLFYKILSGKKSADHYLLAFVLLSFILSGFTNPFLLSSTSAVFYVLPLILASIFRKNPAYANKKQAAPAIVSVKQETVHAL